MTPEVIHFVNLETGRIVTDTATIELPETIDDYVAMTEREFHEYCVAQRRRLDASKEAHRQAQEDFEAAEDERVDRVSAQIADTLGISIDDARLMVPRQQFNDIPDFTVSEKVFGGIVLPEEEEHASE